jgi:PAS domain S-box-containing protein
VTVSRRSFAASALFRTIKESHQLPWWEWDVQRNIVTASPRKATMLGYDPSHFDEQGYQAYTDLLHPDDYERTMQAMRDHLEGRAELYQVDYRIRMHSGDYTWYFDRGAVVSRTDDGSPALLRGIVFDLGPELRERGHVETVVRAVRSALPESAEERHPVVCAQCGRMRYRTDRWVEIGPDFAHGLAGELTHSLCNRCIRWLYPQAAPSIIERLRETERG